MLALRPYQVDALQAVADAEARGVRRLLGVAATGLGKTVIFAALASSRPGRTLILAHRDELIEQAAAKLAEVWPDCPSIGVVKASRDEAHAHAVVASVQTLSRPARLDRLVNGPDRALFGAPRPFDLVVVDEAHHATADSYRAVVDGLAAGTPDGPLLLGVTATPDRADRRGLDALFDEIAFNYDVLFGIRNGYLSDVRGLRLRLAGFDTAGLSVSRGDYDQGAAGRLLTAAGAPDLIVSSWREHASDRRTLVFTPTVALAEAVAAAFHTAGVPATSVDGRLPQDERRARLAAYASGAVQVLVNCAVLTEGYDEPRTDCVVIARPTRSRSLYAQMVGRGTRLHPDKADLLVLDLVGATDDHSLVTLPSLFGLRDDAVRRMESDPTVSATAALADQAALDVAAGLLTAEEADLFRRVDRRSLAWVRVPATDHRYSVNLGRDAGAVVLRQLDPDADLWLAGHRHPDGSKAVLIANVALELAQGVAEDFIRSRYPASFRLADPSAAWRRRSPSPKALAAAKRWRLRVDPAWTAGELSDALDAHIERARSRQARR